MKIAIVHDYLREYGGAERVVEALKKIFPEADVYVGFVDWDAMGEAGERFRTWQIRTTWLQKIPGIKKLYSPLRVLAPRAFYDLDLSSYEIIISSSNAYFAKAVRKGRKKATHLCYCHTPARSLYGYDTQSSQKKSWLVKVGGQFLNHGLRLKDFEVAQKVDVFLANSGVVSRRIQKFYRRESEILYPPVDLIEQAKKLNFPEQKREYYLYVNRLNFAKHPEIAVKVALRLNLKLKVVGSGPMLEELKELVTQDKKTQAKIEFLGAVPDSELMNLYTAAKALLYPVIDEDFGMVPIEAMAFGVPVLAHRSGGPTETIIEGKTGLFFNDLSEEALMEVVKKFQWKVFDHELIKNHAQNYSATAFAQRLRKIIRKHHGAT